MTEDTEDTSSVVLEGATMPANMPAGGLPDPVLDADEQTLVNILPALPADLEDTP